jgi:hypothetical protein
VSGARAEIVIVRANGENTKFGPGGEWNEQVLLVARTIEAAMMNEDKPARVSVSGDENAAVWLCRPSDVAFAEWGLGDICSSLSLPHTTLTVSA